MKMAIIFWLNPKTGIIYHKLYSNVMNYEVGQENQFEHVIIAIGIIKNRKLQVFEKGSEILYIKNKEKVKNKIIDKIIYKLNKMKGWYYGYWSSKWRIIVIETN